MGSLLILGGVILIWALFLAGMAAKVLLAASAVINPLAF